MVKHSRTRQLFLADPRSHRLFLPQLDSARHAAKRVADALQAGLFGRTDIAQFETVTFLSLILTFLSLILPWPPAPLADTAAGGTVLCTRCALQGISNVEPHKVCMGIHSGYRGAWRCWYHPALRRRGHHCVHHPGSHKADKQSSWS